jgi:hypothetical protein
MINDKVFIDGKEVIDGEEQKTIHIVIEGNVDTLNIDTCNELKIKGDVGTITHTNGNVVCHNVNGDVINKNGNIVCRNVSGDATTKNGNVITN